MKKAPLKAPFPAFGSKKKAARMVWERFDRVDNYAEPFFNSGAVLFGNPNGSAPVETVNDLNSYVSNFWRSVKFDPASVANHADWPVNETDLRARHLWLVTSKESEEFRNRMLNDPDYYDPKIAGWWAWGCCLWIGSGWCHEISSKRPDISHSAGRGVHGKTNVPSKKIPHIGDATGKGVHARPQLADKFSRGRGVHSNDAAESVADRNRWLNEWMQRLSDRLRVTRVCCGDWKRICDSYSVTTRLGKTGVFLDPPYREKIEGRGKNRARLYATDEASDLDKLCIDVRDYCIEQGPNRDMRIALCSLEGEGNEILVDKYGWSVVAWKSSGYGNRTKAGKENATRERIYFSPHCVIPERDTYPLFKETEENPDESPELL